MERTICYRYHCFVCVIVSQEKLITPANECNASRGPAKGIRDAENVARRICPSGVHVNRCATQGPYGRRAARRLGERVREVQCVGDDVISWVQAYIWANWFVVPSRYVDIYSSIERSKYGVLQSGSVVVNAIANRAMRRGPNAPVTGE